MNEINLVVIEQIKGKITYVITNIIEKVLYQQTRDKELLSILNKGQQYKNTTSLLKINSQISEPMTNSLNVLMYRSNSDKLISLESPKSLKYKKQVSINKHEQEILYNEQEATQTEVQRLRSQLNKSRTLNQYLKNEVKKFKILYQQIDVFVKSQLYDYFNIQKQIITQICSTIEQISYPQLQIQSSIDSSRVSKPQFQKPQFNQESVSKIIQIVNQMKTRIRSRSFPKHIKQEVQKTPSVYLSPKIGKRTQNILPAVQQFQQLFNE